MNKLWIFGDSFSDGCGLENHPYADFLKENLKVEIPANHSWFELLAKEMDMELKQCGISGCSVTEIITQLLLNVNKFEKDDLIIVGWTTPERLALPRPSNLNKGTALVCVNNDMDAKLVDIDTNHQTKFEDLYLNVLLPNIDLHNHFWTEVGTELIKNISKTYKLKSWFWYGMGLETISTHTNNQVNDGHPSLSGHLHLKNYIKNLEVGTIYDWDLYFKSIEEIDSDDDINTKTKRTLL